MSALQTAKIRRTLIMKTKKADIAAKIIITVVVVILVGLLTAWMVGIFKDKKQDLNSGTEKINTIVSSVAEFDYMSYDGASISGKTLVDLIKETVADAQELSIAVQTYVNYKKTTPVTIYYNKVLTANYSLDTAGAATTLNQSSKSSDSYIAPSGSFLGKVLKNPNDEVTGILFVQKK